MSSLFKPKVPEQKPTPRMPDEEDPAIIEARRRRAMEAQTRGGRASTILSGIGTQLGGNG